MCERYCLAELRQGEKARSEVQEAKKSKPREVLWENGVDFKIKRWLPAR